MVDNQPHDEEQHSEHGGLEEIRGRQALDPAYKDLQHGNLEGLYTKD